MKIKIVNPKSAPYFFCAPFVISFALFLAYPMISMVYTSFFKYNGMSDYRFVKVENYLRLLTDPHIKPAVFNSISFTVGIIVVNVVLALFLAIILNNKLTPIRNLFRSALYIPSLTSIVVAGIFFRLFFAGNDNTPINSLMKFLGIGPREWLFNTNLTATVALVSTSTWRWLGTNVLYFLAALQTISPELYDAAHVDGASVFQRFRYVTLPGVKPILIFLTTILTYGGLRMFAESYVLWTRYTPPGDIGLTIVRHIYQTAFGYFDIGYASAMSVVFFACLMVINAGYIKAFGVGGGGNKK